MFYNLFSELSSFCGWFVAKSLIYWSFRSHDYYIEWNDVKIHVYFCLYIFSCALAPSIYYIFKYNWELQEIFEELRRKERERQEILQKFEQTVQISSHLQVPVSFDKIIKNQVCHENIRWVQNETSSRIRYHDSKRSRESNFSNAIPSENTQMIPSSTGVNNIPSSNPGVNSAHTVPSSTVNTIPSSGVNTVPSSNPGAHNSGVNSAHTAPSSNPGVNTVPAPNTGMNSTQTDPGQSNDPAPANINTSTDPISSQENNTQHIETRTESPLGVKTRSRSNRQRSVDD